MSHERDNAGLLASLERRTLLWLAARLPAWITSDHLTALGFGGMAMVGICYALSGRHRWLLGGAVLSLAVNWFGDSLDGTLARVRNRQRPRYGFYIDHVLDSFGAVILLGGLALSGLMSPVIAALVLIAYLLISIETYLATYSVGRFEMSHWRLGPTELRVLLAAGTLMLFWKSTVTLAGVQVTLFDTGGAVGAAGLLTTTIVAAARHARILYSAEPLSDPARGGA